MVLSWCSEAGPSLEYLHILSDLILLSACLFAVPARPPGRPAQGRSVLAIGNKGGLGLGLFLSQLVSLQAIWGMVVTLLFNINIPTDCFVFQKTSKSLLSSEDSRMETSRLIWLLRTQRINNRNILVLNHRR